MRFITTVYGVYYLPFVCVLLQSIEQYHPFEKVSIFYDDLPDHEALILRDRFPVYEFIQNPKTIEEDHILQKIPLRLRHWFKACELYPEESLFFLDCDAALCKNMANFINDSYDVMYTWKPEQTPLNAGMVAINNNKSGRVFMKNWLALTEEIVHDEEKLRFAHKMNGGGSQHTMAILLDSSDYDASFERTIDGETVRFKGMACKYLNETNSCPITADTHVIHYKTGWHPIILEGKPFTKNRPKDLGKEMWDYWHKLYREFSLTSIESFIAASLKRHGGRFENGLYDAVYGVLEDFQADMLIYAGEIKKEHKEYLAQCLESKTRKVEFTKSNAGSIRGILKRYKPKRAIIFFGGVKKEKAVRLFKDIIVDFQEIIAGFFCASDAERLENNFDRTFFVKGSGNLAVVLPAYKERRPGRIKSFFNNLKIIRKR
ncbi:MAG: hypothetical protein P9L93_06830 [Candidatus Gorgyraea atricola]|nr:hypothetical protein [Candidatus Gorgyraea atricola]